MSQNGTRAPSSRLRRAIVFFNRRAGGSDRTTAVEALSAELRNRGVECDVESESAGLAARLADEAADPRGRAREDGLAVIAAGGDGTVGWAASHLPPHVPLGVFPLGTENLLARYLGATADPGLAADRFCEYRWRTWDAMEVNGRLGLLMVSCGMDAEVVQQVHGSRRGNISHWTYATPLCRALSSYRFPVLRVSQWTGQGDRVDSTAEPWREASKGRWCFVFNAPVYALGLALGRGAIPFDGQLDILTLKRGGVWSMIGYLTATLRGRLDRAAGVGRLQAQRIRIESDQRVPYQLDGDPGGELPVEIVVLPERLRMLTCRVEE